MRTTAAGPGRQGAHDATLATLPTASQVTIIHVEFLVYENKTLVNHVKAILKAAFFFFFLKIKSSSGRARWLTPVIRALREAEAGASLEGRSFKTSLANMFSRNPHLY